MELRWTLLLLWYFVIWFVWKNKNIIDQLIEQMMISKRNDQMVVLKDLICVKELLLKSDRMITDDFSASFTSEDWF